jgi:hypothetical protein
MDANMRDERQSAETRKARGELEAESAGSGERRGDVETWRRGDVETWRRGDVERQSAGARSAEQTKQRTENNRLFGSQNALPWQA